MTEEAEALKEELDVVVGFPYTDESIIWHLDNSLEYHLKQKWASQLKKTTNNHYMMGPDLPVCGHEGDSLMGREETVLTLNKGKNVYNISIEQAGCSKCNRQVRKEAFAMIEKINKDWE